VLTIKIPLEAVSLNQLYPSNKSGRRFLSASGKEYKEHVFHATRKALAKTEFTIDQNKHFLTLEIFFYTSKLLTKESKISKNKPDLSNCVKALEDAVFEAIGLDDYLVLGFDGIHQLPSVDPMIVVIVRKHLQSNILTTISAPENILQ